MIFALTLLFLLSQLILGVYLWLKVKHLYKYPNLFGSPVIGNLYYFYKHLTLFSPNSIKKYFERVSEKYGYDIFFTFANGRLAGVVSCPHLTKEISSSPYSGDKPKGFSVMHNIVNGILLYSAANNEWKTRRNEANRALNRNNIEGRYHEIFIRYGKKIIEAIEKEPNCTDLHFYINSNNFHNVKETLFGMNEFLIADKKMINQLLYFVEITGNALGNVIYGTIFYYISFLFGKTIFPAMAKHSYEMTKSATGKAIQIRKEMGNDESFQVPLAVVIGMRNVKYSRSYEEVNAELDELAGVAWHSTSVTMCGVVSYLAMFPEMQESVWMEQLQIFGYSNRDPTTDDLKEMVYLERFLKESLRFLSPAGIVKFITKDVNIGVMTIPAGVDLYILLHKMRKDQRYWKDPQVFNPDRFIEEIVNVPTYAYATFGVGARSCPGKLYAFTAMKIIISSIIRKYKLSTDVKFQDLVYTMDLMHRITTLPLINIEERKYT